jgi:hypothetical protein
MTYQQIFNLSITMGIAIGAGTAYPFEASNFIPSYLWGLCCLTFTFLCSVLEIIFYGLFVLFLLSIVLSILYRFMPSHNPLFAIFKTFL